MSNASSSVLMLAPALKDYAWGDDRFIQGLLGAVPDGQPMAEAWFGAHPQGPSTLPCHDGDTLLGFLEGEGSTAWLGPAAGMRQGTLPYLAKFLAAARPLSIQVHPDDRQARDGFAREDAQGIARDAPNRCYRDPYPKPEIIIALTEFQALCGFRSDEEIRAALERHDVLRDLAPLCGRGWNGQRELVSHWFSLDRAEVDGRQRALLATLQGLRVRTAAENLLVELAEAAGEQVTADPGLLFALLLAQVRLQPGQGLFRRAGVPHAYLSGAGLEVMGASDNVLRAGLTSKHVAPDELARIVRFAAGGAWRVDGEVDAAGWRVYRTAATEFEVATREMTVHRPVAWRAEGPELLIALAGESEAELLAGEKRVSLRPGSGAFVAHDTLTQLRGVGPVARVRVPL